ncbi:hypothetical protein ABIA33_007690 [Streptacidiphilus sp. MAP12-16]
MSAARRNAMVAPDPGRAVNGPAVADAKAGQRDITQ